MTTLYICGAGNPEIIRLTRVVNPLNSRWQRILLLDDDPAKHGQQLLGLDIVGPFGLLADADPELCQALTCVARTMQVRWAVRERLAAFGLPFAQLIHPAVETSDVTLGRDIVVADKATLSPLVTVGDGSMIYTGAVVGHECRLGQCCFVAPGAVLTSRIELGDGVMIGANATVLPERIIGPWATVGAGSVVSRDVDPGATVIGNPARVVFRSAAPEDGE
ncbi:acetyltransferase [Candidatus Sumerlaeota bacterium]